MKKSKFILLIIAIVFAFVDIGWQIFDIVQYFQTNSAIRTPVFYVVLNFITIAQCLAVAVLLIISIWGKGKYFKQRYGFYMIALVISIIINLLSVTSILLIVTMFIPDWEWIRPNQEESVVEVISEDDKTQKIAKLRKMLEKGEITEEEFNELLTELL